MVYIDRAPQWALKEAERTADAVRSTLRPKTRRTFRVIVVTTDKVTIEEDGTHNTVSIYRAGVSPSGVSQQNVDSKNKFSTMPQLSSTVMNEDSKVLKTGQNNCTAQHSKNDDVPIPVNPVT